MAMEVDCNSGGDGVIILGHFSSNQLRMDHGCCRVRGDGEQEQNRDVKVTVVSLYDLPRYLIFTLKTSLFSCVVAISLCLSLIQTDSPMS